jgi:hypothetical protein
LEKLAREGPVSSDKPVGQDYSTSQAETKSRLEVGF